MITVVGSINLDLVATSGRLPVPGETVSGKEFTTAAGGKGANQALAAHRAGAKMRLVGAVGEDAFANEALAELRKDDADLSNVRSVAGATGVALILVSGDGENMIVVVPGANGTVDAQVAEDGLGALSAPDFVLLQQEVPTPAIKAALQKTRAVGATSVLNIAPITEDTVQLAKLADIVVANETEFALLAGVEVTSENLEQQAIDHAAAADQILIITLGAAGAVAATADGTLIKVAAPKIEPVDTVGAGDTFCGYLAAALDAGESLEVALKHGAAAGSLACLKPGAQPAIPYKSAVASALNLGSK